MENQKKDSVVTIYDTKLDLALAEKFHKGTQMTLKYVSLVSLTMQNAALNLMMRVVRTQREPFLASTAVLLAEMIKLFACLLMVGAVDEGSFRKLLIALKRHVWQQPKDTLKVAIPSFVYLLQNNLLYVGATHLDAATCQVTYQLKILTTALFSVVMLNKRLSLYQWIALVILFLGVALVQLAQLTAPSTAHHMEQRPMVGFIAIVVACCLSGFAGVYFEKILKGADVSVWMRNIQLCVSSIPLGIISVFCLNGDDVQSKGFFYGYNGLVWTVILLQAVGGLVVAVVVKFADNILKGFSTSLAIVLSCVFSVYLFNFQLTAQFVMGASLVIGSIFLYSHPQNAANKN